MMIFPKQKEVCYKQRGTVWPFGELAIENLFKIFQTMMEGAGWRYERWDMWVPESFLRRGDAEKLMSCVAVVLQKQWSVLSSPGLGSIIYKYFIPTSSDFKGRPC